MTCYNDFLNKTERDLFITNVLPDAPEPEVDDNC